MSDLADGLNDHIRSLTSYARVLVSNPADADDLVQESLRRALTYSVSGQTYNWRAYLIRILHNVRADHMAKKARDREMPIDDYVGQLSYPASQHGFLEFRDVARALVRLSGEQREVLLLVCLEGLSYNEAAEVLGVPVGTVMSRLSRARNSLKHILSDRPGDEAC